MLGFLETMNDFLNTQREVMEAYLRGAAAPSITQVGDRATPRFQDRSIEPNSSRAPGSARSWNGSPGRSIRTNFPLTAAGDPVAENHTLGGRRVSALEPELKGLPVVPFAVMAEMVAQVGSLLVPSGLVLDSLHDVRAHRWVQYEDDCWLELQGVCDPAQPFSVRVVLLHHEGNSTTEPTEGRPVFEGVARFAARRPEPAPAEPLQLALPPRQPVHRETPL